MRVVVYCPFCTLLVDDDSIHCSECGSDLAGVLSLIGVSAETPKVDEPQMNVSLSDTAVAGDVNIVQRLQADTEEIVDKLVDQLDRFDINKPGLSVPEDGFSRLDVEAAIPLVRENMDILKGMTSPHLLQFGKLLDSMGWPQIAKRVGQLLLEREDVAAEPLWLARSHLIMARSSGETFDPAAAILHADKAMETAASADLKDIEAYALYLSIDKRKDLALDTSALGERAEVVLESAGSDPGPAGAWCHLALSRHLDAVNPLTAEHHEAMGFQHSSNHSDLEAMVATLLATAENQVWTIKESFWVKVKEDCELNGLASYSMLVELANFVRSGSEQQLLAGIRTLTRHAKGRGMLELQTLSSLLTCITDTNDMLATTQHGSPERESRIKQILGEEKAQESLDEILTRSYQGFDDSLLYQYILISLTGTQLPRSAIGYLEMERAYPNDSVKAMMMLYRGLTRAGNDAQTVVSEVVGFLDQTKLNGNDTAWRLVADVAQYLAVRFDATNRPEVRGRGGGEFREDTGSGDWIIGQDQTISSRIPKVGITISFFSVVFAEALVGFFSVHPFYHFDGDLFVITLVASICIWTVLLLITGTPRRKRIPKSETVSGSKHLSLFPAFLAVGFTHLLILLIFWLKMGNLAEMSDTHYRLMFCAAGLIFCCFFFYSANNTSNINSDSGYLFPRTDFILFSMIYWIFMYSILFFMLKTVFTNDDDGHLIEALIWEMVNWMIITSICIPLLYAGFTKNPKKISGMGVMGLVASALMFLPLTELRYEVDDDLMTILLIPCIIILSYLVWMSPWPDEKPEWGEV